MAIDAKVAPQCRFPVRVTSAILLSQPWSSVIGR